MKDERLDDLIDQHLNSAMSEASRRELEDRLLHSAADRARFWELAETHAFPHESIQQKLAKPVAKIPRRTVWLQWRPLAAAAAGLVIGLFSASVLFAYAAPSLRKVVTLLNESFESGPAPPAKGVPIEPGVWSGDYSEIVGEHRGVKPESGGKMLRFLRGDYEGRPIPESFSSDVFRLIDVRGYRHEFADGGAVVQLSVAFNAAAFGDDEAYQCGLTIFALDAALVNHGSLNAERILSTESLAMSRSSHLRLDRDTATWQRLSNELRLPPNTDYIMIRFGVSHAMRQEGRRTDSFAGHYADNIRVVLARRPEVPIP